MLVSFPSWRRSNRSLGALALTFLVGCGPISAGDGEPLLGTQRAPIKIANSMTMEELLFNALLANHQANALLSTNGLAPLFSSTPADAAHTHIRNQLMDPAARRFMEYLVSCALSSSQQPVSWQAANGATQGTWAGGIGLCTQWRDSSPSQACLKQVSSCLLARVNPLDRKVELSFRGKKADDTVLSLEPQPLALEFDPDLPASSSHVASLEPCVPSQSGPSRACGWTRDYIGACTPGTQVWVGANGPAACPNPQSSQTSTQVMLRVCEGIVACDKGPRTLAESWKSCGLPQSYQHTAVPFTCPSSGYFNVMKARYDSNQQLGTVSIGVQATTQNNAQDPLPELKAFKIREGAFYGNLFTRDVKVEVTLTYNAGTGALTQTRIPSTSIPGSIYPQMYACQDPQWSNGAAYAAHRVCALPGQNANCAATVVGSCGSPSVCGTSDAAPTTGDGDYGNCSSPTGVTWNNPLTVFLNAPCDLMPDGEDWLCKRIL